jgi:hypothetical protein
MAILSASELRTRYLPNLTGTGDDTYLGTLCTVAETACARWCGVPSADGTAEPVFSSTSYTLYGPDADDGVRTSPDGTMVYLYPRPVSSVTSLYEDGDELYTSAELVSSSDYTVYTWGIRLKPTGGTPELDLSLGPRSLKVVFVAGYSTVPDALKQAVGAMAKHLWFMRHHSGVSSVSEGGESASVEQEIPEHVQDLLRPFRHSTALG